MNKNKSTHKSTIIIATGGTGGHVAPALSIIAKLIDHNLIIITDIRGEKFFKKFYNNQGKNINKNDLNHQLIVHDITSPNNKGLIKKLKSLFQILLSTIKCLNLFIINKPEIIIGFGGYSSVTPLIAAKFLRIPIIIHEQNAVLGRANRFLSKFANILALSFKDTKFNKKIYKSIFTGNPVREEFNIIGRLKYNPPEQGKHFGILIMGGSLGASFFSDKIPAILCSLPIELKKKLKVFHQVKEEEIINVKKLYDKNKINSEVKSFFEDIFIQFKKAHLIIARSGGSSIAEILAANRPTIFIPLPSALDNHQEENAKYIVKKNGGWLLDQNKTSPKLFKKILIDLILNPKKLKEVSIQIKKISSYHLSLCNNKTPTSFFINIITKLLPSNIKKDLKS